MAGVDPVFIEHLAEALCGISAVLFTFIATFSRSEKAEYMAQNVIAGALILCAIVLWWLALSGGSFGAHPIYQNHFPWYVSSLQFLLE